jgi:hypothetical protein
VLLTNLGTPNNNNTYLIFWENISPEATRVLLNKKLFGYRANGKDYPGAVQRFSCQRLGKGCISVPAVNLLQVLTVFKSLDVRVKIREVMDFGERLQEEA